jgi:TM2 domain-containing membrane protein YozV
LGLAALGTAIPTLLGYSVIQWGTGEHEGTAALAIAAGLIVGPSVGQFYHGYIGHGLAATSLRVLGTGIVFVSAISALGNALGSMDCVPEEHSPSCETESSGPGGGIAFGLSVYAIGVTYSLLQPLFRVRLSHRKGSEIGANNQNLGGYLPHHLSPIWFTDAVGRMKLGLAASWGF